MKVSEAIRPVILSDAQQARLLKHMAAVREHWESVHWIKRGLRDQDMAMAAEAWVELDGEVQRALWIAPSYGGVWTTRERESMKSPEFLGAFHE